MSATLTTPKTTSGGEIITHLINASDGEGLHFDGAAGNIDIPGSGSAPVVALGTQFSMEFIIQMDTAPPASGWSYHITDFGNGGRFFLGYFDGELIVYSGAAYTTGLDPLSDLKPHHLVLTIDGTAAKLFDNGNEIGTIPAITSPDIDLCADARLGSKYDGTAGWFDGTIYRARFWNKTLSQAEVTEVYENATIPRAIVANCISDYDLAFANPTQSLTVQDRRGAADGTASATGVSQVTPIIQVNTVELVTENETLMGKIKSVTSSITVGAVFIYDTAQDSDPSWRKRCKGLSWFDEAASATRSARSEFPAMALIVTDAGNLTIYDLDDPAMPMWMVFTNASNNVIPATTNRNAFALNGRICTNENGQGAGYGTQVISFVEDTSYHYITTNTLAYKSNLLNRNAASGYANINSNGIVANEGNAVAATVLEGAEIGALGLPIPTVAVATDGGVSVIHPSGDVYDLTNGSAQNDSRIVFFTEDGKLGMNYEASGGVANASFCGITNIPFADATVAVGGSPWLEEFNSMVGVTVYPLLTTTLDYTSASSEANAIAPMGKDGLALGYPDRLSIVKRNKGNGDEGAVAYITSAYSSGYMVGDIRGAFLANSKTTDVSVKGNTLTENGSVTATKFNDDLYGYSGFSASNYLSRAYDADFDFGTGDFSIMFWLKDADTSEYQNYVSRGDTPLENGDWLFQSNGSSFPGRLDFYIATPGWSLQLSSSAGKIVENQWTQVVLVRRSGTLTWYFNGQPDTSVANVVSLSPSSPFTIGHALGEAVGPADNASLSLLRISATAPTPQQIKEIYDAEKPLFAANAKCLLQSPHGSLSNTVNDLAFDKSTGLLAVAQTASSHGVQLFRGLEMAEATSYEDSTDWSSSSTSLISTAGSVVAPYRSVTTGGVLVDLPSVDVRSALNEGEDKLPDDGKLHFSGVTTDATVTTIAQIPMAANERMIVRAKVEAIEYQNFAADSEWFHGEVRRQYRCDMSGARDQDAAVDYKYTDAYTSTMDIDWSHNSSNTAALKVTGVAGTRIVWSASVEVQRISEKTYER